MTTKEHSAQQHQTEINTLRFEIENLETEINEFKVHTHAKANNEKPLNVLRRHRDEAKAKLTDLQAAGKDGWEGVKYGLKQTWMTMKQRVANLTARLKS